MARGAGQRSESGYIHLPPPIRAAGFSCLLFRVRARVYFFPVSLLAAIRAPRLMT